MTSFKNLKRQIHCCSIVVSFLDSMFLFFIKISLQEQLNDFYLASISLPTFDIRLYIIYPFEISLPNYLWFTLLLRHIRLKVFFICCLLIILQSKETFCFALFCFGLMQIALKPDVPCSCSVDFSYTFFYLFNYSLPVGGTLPLASYGLDFWPYPILLCY